MRSIHLPRRLIQAALAALVIALLIGAWQTAYARGREDGRSEVSAIRTEFIQARQAPAGAAAGPGGGAVGAGGVGAGGAGFVTKGGQGGQGGQAGGGQRPVVNGTVEKNDGGVLTVTTSEGSVTVTAGERTQVRRQVNGSVADIQPGDRIVVSGDKRGDADYTATLIQVQGQ